MKKRFSVLSILTLAILSVSTFYPMVLGAPVGSIYAPPGTLIPNGDINGVIAGEWSDAGDWVDTTGYLKIKSEIRAKHDGTYLYLLLVVVDKTDNPFVDPMVAHDWAGVEFDNNGDEARHGTEESPDDAEFCNYQSGVGEDWWTAGHAGRGSDTENHVVAARGFNGTHTMWEFKKELSSGDTGGWDIALDPSQTDIYGKDRIKIALAYQDGKIGKHMYHSPWFMLILSAPPQPGWIEGAVTDFDTNAPIVGATVTADGYSITTDDQGYYTIELPAGTHDVTASASGYFSETKPDISVEAGDTTIVDFTLELGAPVPSATLCKKGAWPEHNRWDDSKDPDLTLTGLVHNDGTLPGLYVRVRFEISYEDATWSETFYTTVAMIPPCTIINLISTITRADLNGYGTYYAEAQAQYLNPETALWIEDGEIYNFKFILKP